MTIKPTKKLFLSLTLTAISIFGFTTAKCAPNGVTNFTFINATNPHVDLFLMGIPGICEITEPVMPPNFIPLPLNFRLASDDSRHCDDTIYNFRTVLAVTDANKNPVIGMTLLYERLQYAPVVVPPYYLQQSGNNYIITNYPSLSKK